MDTYLTLDVKSSLSSDTLAATRTYQGCKLLTAKRDSDRDVHVRTKLAVWASCEHSSLAPKLRLTKSFLLASPSSVPGCDYDYVYVVIAVLVVVVV